MIYLFAGDNAERKIESYEEFIQSVKNGADTFFINSNDFDRSQIESFYSGHGLFFTECTIVFSNVLEKEEIRDFVLAKLKFLNESGNSFVFLEGKLNKSIINAFKKEGAKLNVFELPKIKQEKFNNFLLANAFAQKDKLSLWIYFRLAMDKGVGLEELVGVLFWKVKEMLLKRNFNKFSFSQLTNTANELSYLLPDARRKGYDAEYAFEQFLLEIF
jgi:DNA polymerase III delta subunit